MYQKDLDLGRLFEVLLPCFIDILKNGKPSFVSNAGEHVHTSPSFTLPKSLMLTLFIRAETP